jgi:hypothetical protein
MKKIREIRSEIQKAVEAYHAIVHTAPAADVKKASDRVKAARAALSTAICDGAKPCPSCGAAPHGIEQPRASSKGENGVEYEVGCISCADHRVRGGLLPRHAVEAWNEAVEAWNEAVDEKIEAAQ